MKLKHFIALIAAFTFFFVTSTQDIYASHSSQEIIKQQKKSIDMSQIDSDIHVQLLKNDLILGNEDGGGYYRRYDYTWLWITLITCAILIVILVLVYSGDSWYWY
jgi:hypothetical protein